MSKGKNCHNCKEFYHETEVDSDGYIIGDYFACDKQYEKFEQRDEGDAFNDRLQLESYQKKGKVCFEPKNDDKSYMSNLCSTISEFDFE